MAIIDVVSWNCESELFEIRYNILKDVVEEFRVIEFDKTFSGKPRKKSFDVNWPFPKVKNYFIKEEQWSKYKDLAQSSPNTLGAEHWKTEFMQKESIKDCLTDLDDENIIYIGDVDEVWETPVGFYTKHFNFDEPAKLKLRVYTYWLNNRSSEEFWGTIACHYKDIKDKCLNHIRTNLRKTGKYYGYHFTSMGGYDKVKEKLTDSYTEDSYATEQVLNNLEDNIKENKDFLNRDFHYATDESELPKYLLDNKEKYKHLFK